ncbi:hypothetical protein HYX06_05760 [Candidatus Woesearchaeota archaeon]|nr:hypothetical protein [Candidatus Woesearchaeota archaeon]
MQAERFNTELFRDNGNYKVEYIDPVLDKHARQHLLHIHVLNYQGCTGLAYWAKHRIQSSGTPVLHINAQGRQSLLPESELPDNDVSATNPYAITKDGILLRLDMLPSRYHHESAYTGGLPFSKEFLKLHKELADRLRQDFEARGQTNSAARHPLVRDPDVIKAAEMTMFLRDGYWFPILHYAMQTKGMSLEGLEDSGRYTSENCIENLPFDFDMARLIEISRLMGGGWIDFIPGRKESLPKAGVTCNFTIVGRDEIGLKAIVFSAFASNKNVTAGQQEFIDDVVRAFGIE